MAGVNRTAGLHASSRTMSAPDGLQRIISEVNKNADETSRAAAKQPLLNGLIVTGISVTAVSAAFNHGLGRQPQGWFIVDKQADVNVWRTNWSNRTINLVGDANATVSIYIF